MVVIIGLFLLCSVLFESHTLLFDFKIIIITIEGNCRNSVSICIVHTTSILTILVCLLFGIAIHTSSTIFYNCCFLVYYRLSKLK